MIGERVRLAREACLLTQMQLADTSGVSQGTLSDIESGRIASPPEEAVEAIGRATGFPTGFFFLGPLPDFPEGHYRKLKRGTRRVSRQVRAQVRHFLEVVQRAETLVALPQVSLRPIRGDVTSEDIESAANDVRASLRIGMRDPIPNLTRALERAGVVIIHLPTDMADHDGFSAWPDFGLDDGRPIIALARGHPGDRDRFTLAHETGHLVLHTGRSDVDPDIAEAEANRFAGALLLPASSARDALRSPVTLTVLKNVKATFGCSIGVGAQRALDLGLITHGHFVSLRKQISARGWNRAEPVEVGTETPQLISKVVAILAGEGSMTDRAGRIPMSLFAYRAAVG